MPPLPMLMSPLRYAVTRKSRAISRLSFSRILCVRLDEASSTYCSISESLSLALKSSTEQPVELIAERGNDARAAIIKYL